MSVLCSKSCPGSLFLSQKKPKLLQRPRKLYMLTPTRFPFWGHLTFLFSYAGPFPGPLCWFLRMAGMCLFGSLELALNASLRVSADLTQIADPGKARQGLVLSLDFSVFRKMSWWHSHLKIHQMNFFSKQKKENELVIFKYILCVSAHDGHHGFWRSSCLMFGQWDPLQRDPKAFWCELVVLWFLMFLIWNKK